MKNISLLRKISNSLFAHQIFRLCAHKILKRNQYMHLIENYYSAKGVEFVGGGVRFISPEAHIDTSGKVKIGEGCTITARAIILTHDYSIDYGLIAAQIERTHETKIVKNVSIGRQCFIGQRAIILPGVTIGNNCVIGIGAIVTHDIPDNSVCAGVPARIIRNTDAWGLEKFENESEYMR